MFERKVLLSDIPHRSRSVWQGSVFERVLKIWSYVMEGGPYMFRYLGRHTQQILKTRFRTKRWGISSNGVGYNSDPHVNFRGMNYFSRLMHKIATIFPGLTCTSFFLCCYLKEKFMSTSSKPSKRNKNSRAWNTKRWDGKCLRNCTFGQRWKLAPLKRCNISYVR